MSPLRWPHAIFAVLAVWWWLDVLVGRAPGWSELVAAGIAVALLAWAVADPRAQGFASALWRGWGARDAVALTFDDGPDPKTTPAILDLLKRHETPATFFVLTQKAEAHPDLIQRMLSEGHAVEIHGVAHRWLEFVTPRRAQEALELSQGSLRALGADPKYFRPPYGVVVPALGVALRRVGLTMVGWSLRSGDGGAFGGPAGKVTRILRRLRAGDIVLFHDAPQRPGGRRPWSHLVLEDLLVGLRQRALRPVRLDDLLT